MNTLVAIVALAVTANTRDRGGPLV
jgi:hypothetical protein